jgi:hypothetical protein
MVGRCVVCGKLACKKCGGMCSKCGRTLCQQHATIQQGIWYCQQDVPPPSPPPPKQGCFIVTATLGYSAQERLGDFYWFRDTVLAKNRIGHVFIKAYYTISPSIARLITTYIRLQTFSRRLIVEPIGRIIRIFRDRDRVISFERPQ